MSGVNDRRKAEARELSKSGLASRWAVPRAAPTHGYKLKSTLNPKDDPSSELKMAVHGAKNRKLKVTLPRLKCLTAE